MRTSELLIKAKAEIDTPKKWTKGYLARNKNGNGLIYLGPMMTEGVCFCSMGALLKAGNGLGTLSAEDLLGNAIREFYPTIGGIASFNDSPYTKHEDVMKVFDRAIDLAKKEEHEDIGVAGEG